MSKRILSFLNDDSKKSLKSLLNSKDATEANTYDDKLFLSTGQRVVGIDMKDDKLKSGDIEITTDKIIEGDNKYLNAEYISKIDAIPEDISEAFIKDTDTLDDILTGTTNIHYTPEEQSKVEAIPENIADAFLKSTDNLDNISDGTTYSRTKADGLVSGYPRTNKLSVDSGYNLVSDNEKTGAGRAFSSLNEDNLLTTGIIDSEENELSTNSLISEISKVEAALDLDGYLTKGVKYGETIKSAEDIITEINAIPTDVSDLSDTTTLLPTANEKTGGSRAYSALDDDAFLVSGIKVDGVENEILVTEMYSGINRANTAIDEDNTIISDLKDSSDNLVTIDEVKASKDKTDNGLDSSGYAIKGLKSVSEGIYETSSLTLRKVADSFKKSGRSGEWTQDTLDDVAEGATYKRTTASEKAGGGYAFTGLNSSGYLKSGFISSSSTVTTAQMLSDRAKISTAFDANSYLKTGVVSGVTQLTAGSLIDKTQNLDSDGKLSCDNLNDGTLFRRFTVENETKLEGIEAGATKNKAAIINLVKNPFFLEAKKAISNANVKLRNKVNPRKDLEFIEAEWFAWSILKIPSKEEFPRMMK